MPRAATALQPGQAGAVPAQNILDFTVLQFPHMARNNDFDPLRTDPRVRLRFARLTHDWGRPDAILIPGGSRTADDMQWMHRCGAARRLHDYVAGGGVVLGICGGYQMLGRTLTDPRSIDGRTKFARGLDLLPIVTWFSPDKVRCDTTVHCLLPELQGVELHGREGRYGRSDVLPHNGDYLPLARVTERSDRPVRAAEGEVDGLVRADRRVWGTYLHRIFANPAWNDMFFAFLLRRRGR